MSVVVLDNDPSMRTLVAYALNLRQLDASAAGTVEEAEALLPAARALLMDFHLGGGHNGAELARRWHEEGRLPPFWLVTGTPEDPEALALAELPELQRVVGKPFSLLELAAEVQRLLAPPPEQEEQAAALE